MLYSIEKKYHGKPSGWFIAWNNENGFYEVDRIPTPRFTEEQKNAIIEDLKNKYVYEVVVRDEGGNKVEVSCLNRAKENAIIANISFGGSNGGLYLIFN